MRLGGSVICLGRTSCKHIVAWHSFTRLQALASQAGVWCGQGQDVGRCCGHACLGCLATWQLVSRGLHDRLAHKMMLDRHGDSDRLTAIHPEIASLGVLPLPSLLPPGRGSRLLARWHAGRHLAQPCAEDMQDCIRMCFCKKESIDIQYLYLISMHQRRALTPYAMHGWANAGA